MTQYNVYSKQQIVQLSRRWEYFGCLTFPGKIKKKVRNVIFLNLKLYCTVISSENIAARAVGDDVYEKKKWNNKSDDGNDSIKNLKMLFDITV
jgi:hypothetical protein